jgi:ABC-type spermidine/putrescine transport system permease subunit II
LRGGLFAAGDHGLRERGLSVKIAALVLVIAGTIGVLTMFVLMRRKLEELRRYKEGGE